MFAKTLALLHFQAKFVPRHLWFDAADACVIWVSYSLRPTKNASETKRKKRADVSNFVSSGYHDSLPTHSQEAYKVQKAEFLERTSSVLSFVDRKLPAKSMVTEDKPKVSDSMSVWIAWEIIEKHGRFKGGYCL